MKIPRLSLPRLPLRFPNRPTSGVAARTASRFTGSSLSGLLIGIVIVLAGFVIGFLIAFPQSALLNRVEYEISRRSPVQIHIGEMSLAFPLGINARKVLVTPPVKELPPFKLASLTVKPFLSSLFGGNPGMNFEAEIPPGEIRGWARKNGQVDITAQEVPILLPQLGLTSLGFSAILQSGKVTGSMPPTGDEENLLDLQLDQAQLTGMESLGLPRPVLSLGKISLRAQGKGNTLKLETLQSEGGEVELSGDGHLQFAEPFSTSRLNLNLTLTPKEGFPRELGELLGLFVKPRPDGSFRMKLAGPLTRLSVH